MELAPAVERAVSCGLAGIAFTDHVDIDYPDRSYDFSFDVDTRAEFIDGLKRAYAGVIEIFHGVEIGLQPHVIEQSRAFIKRSDFDIVIASLHVIDRMCLTNRAGFFVGKSKDEAYRRYLEEMRNTLEAFGDFDVVGHIGYLRRYSPYPDNSLRYVDYGELLDKILAYVIGHGKAIELNTSGYAYHLASPIPDYDIIKRYKELGGTLVTLASDAHTVDGIGRAFDMCTIKLGELGFMHTTCFRHRKPETACRCAS